MTYIAYAPPKRMFADTLLAFKDFEMASAWSARIDPDPLGPVNRIVSIWYGKRRVKAGLARIPAGAVVKLIREPSGYTLDDLMLLTERTWDSRGYLSTNGIPEPVQLPPRREPGWYVEVDGRTVLYASDAEIWPAPTPEVPRGLKVVWNVIPATKRVLRKRARAVGDRIAGRFGYVHESEVGDW